MTKTNRFLVAVAAVAALAVGVVGAGASPVSAAPAIDCRRDIWPLPAGCGQVASYRAVFPTQNAVWSPHPNAAVSPSRVCATNGAGNGWVRVDPVSASGPGSWAVGVERGPSPGAGYRGTLTVDRRAVSLGRFAAGECKRVQLRSLGYGRLVVNVAFRVRPSTWPYPEPPVWVVVCPSLTGGDGATLASPGCVPPPSPLG